MTHAIGGRHILYLTMPGDADAVSACYSCGIQKPAMHLIWMRHPRDLAFLALCAACHAAPSADSAALLRARLQAYRAARSAPSL